MTGYSITQIMQDARAANNGRLNSMAMTAEQKRLADKAVERGLLTSHHATFPGFGPVKLYQIA